MTQENIPSVNPESPLPLSNTIQKVTPFEGWGWKAVIECPEGGSSDCADNHKFSSVIAGINEQRRQMNLHRMGIR